MEHPHPPDVTVFLWDRVALKLNLVLHSVPSPVAPFDSTRIAWADIPMCLAERGLLLQGLSAVCLPTPDNYALDDRVSDSLSLWSNERLQALDSALTTRTLTIVPREPLARRAIFELIDTNGRRKDTTLGFSEEWQHRHMFAEQIYRARTTPQLRAMNIDSLLSLLRTSNLATTYIPWTTLPHRLLSIGQYMSGLPRICLPNMINRSISADDPSPATNWRKDQRVALQRSLDSGLLKVLPRPSGRNVIFEVLESDGSLHDTDCGLDIQTFELAMTSSNQKCTPKQNSPQDAQSTALVVIPAISWPQYRQTNPYQKRMDVTENYMELLRVHGLLLDSPEGPAWVYVPQMLATKRVHVFGLPRICLPLVRDDDVLANYDPRQWSDSAQDAFLHALHSGRLKILPSAHGERVLYKALHTNGETSSDTLGFSEKWCKENLDPPDFTSISPPAYNIEMWLDMLGHAGIPCHDLRGRRRIQWLQLPLALAQRRLYISGCPVECLPRVEDDMVSELSSPYFYNDRQVALMYDAFKTKKVSIRPREPHRTVLFSIETDDGIVDFDCGFTKLWFQSNMQTAPSNIPIPPSYSSGAVLSNGATERNLVHQRNQPAPVIAGAAYPTPTDSTPASPIPLPSTQQRTAEDPTRSLKVIIPAFKRRHLLATTTVASSSSSSTSTQVSIQATYSDSTPPEQSTPPKNPTGQLAAESQLTTILPRHMLPSRRSVVNIQQPSPRRRKRQLSPVLSEAEDNPDSFGPRTSMSPPLPPAITLPDPLPPVPVPTFLPKPGGNLIWDQTLGIWELTISEVWPPEEWKKTLPVFPARVTWNATQMVWMCVPSRALTAPSKTNVGLSPAVRASLEASTRDGEVESIEEGLSIIWHRWRRSWGLFKYVPPTLSSNVS